MTKFYSEPVIELRKYRINCDIFTDSQTDPNLNNNDEDDPPADDEGGNGYSPAGWFID